MSVRMVRCGGAPVPPAVAFGLGRRLGSAPTRNRLRRRLRGALALESGELLPGASYLLAASPGARSVPFDRLRRDLRGALRAADRTP